MANPSTELRVSASGCFSFMVSLSNRLSGGEYLPVDLKLSVHSFSETPNPKPSCTDQSLAFQLLSYYLRAGY